MIPNLIQHPDLKGQIIQEPNSEKSSKNQPNHESSDLANSHQSIFYQKRSLEQNHSQESIKLQEERSQKENPTNKKTRRLIKIKNENKGYELRRENPREKSRNNQEKSDKQTKQGPSKKQEQKNLEAYIKIVDYLKKIQWDQQNAQNKMNPFHFMTAACFWFWVCAEYFSYDFFAKKNPEEAANQIINRVQRIVFSVPLRLNKTLLQQTPSPILSFETKNLKQCSQKISEALIDLVQNKGYEYHFENVEKCVTLSDVADDDLFRSSTRSLLYNYVKANYQNQLKHILDIQIPQQQEILIPESNDLQPIEQQKIIFPQSGPRLEDLPNHTQHLEKTETLNQQPKSIKKVQKIKQVGKEELLLSSLVNLPLDKVISILESSIPDPNIPVIQEPMIPISNDPFQLISQIHPLEYEFLEYLKKRRSLQSLQFSNNKQINKKGQENVQQDAKCQICTDGDYTEDNLIVFCSTCNISLHQRCVGLVKVPSESWICQVCNAFGPKGRWLRCALCTVKGGALKRSTITSDTTFFKQINPSYHQYLKSCTHLKAKQEYPINKEQLNDQLFYDYYQQVQAIEQPPNCHYVWVHYACSIWVPECYFQQKNGIINIKGIQTIDKKRFKIVCQICQTSRTGAAVKCPEQNCELYYHPQCARKAGVYMQQRHLDRMYYFIYCNAHKPLKITRTIQSKSKKYKDQIIKFCRAIQKYVQTYKIANVPFKLLKSCKRGNRIRKQVRVKENKEDRETQNQDFMRKLKDYLIGNRKLIIQIKKVGDTGNYKVIDIEQPIKRALRSNISKNDQIWQFFTYKNMNSSQLFKKYKKIMKDNINLRQSFTRQIKNQSKSQRKREKRRHKEIEYENMTVQQDPDKIYCVCRQKYIVGQFMLQCQICSQWFHFKCIGFIGKEQDAEKVEFNCYKCEKYQKQQEKQMRRQKYKQYYDPNFVIKIPEQQQSDSDKSSSKSFSESQDSNHQQQKKIQKEQEQDQRMQIEQQNSGQMVDQIKEQK